MDLGKSIARIERIIQKLTGRSMDELDTSEDLVVERREVDAIPIEAPVEAPKVRCKMRCSLSSDGSIALEPVYSGSEENEAFFAATPAGSISLSIAKPEVAQFFAPGFEYYVDFTPAS